MQVVRVLVADDDENVRSALAEVLSDDPRFLVVGATEDGSALSSLVQESRPDVVLLDVRMPAGGPDAVRAILAGSGAAAPAVIGISAEASVATVTAMLRAGAVGYLLKGRIGASLTDFVARCAAGEVVLAVPCAVDALRRAVRPAEAS